ncbi:MAG TPA: hypothetical protein VHE35_27520 [Kofleriaceae bacterium]|nr:hypothetical protein [Kofleriaceae bacterium]
MVVTFRAPGADTPIDLSRLPAESYELVYPAGVARLATVVGPDARFTRLTDAPATVELRLHDPDARASVSYTAELPPCTPG